MIFHSKKPSDNILLFLKEEFISVQYIYAYIN